jgi:SAM-dependent methyltransferase
MPRNRSSITYKLARAVSSPGRIVPYFRNVVRNRRFRRDATSHPGFYRSVMADNVRRKTANGAVGTESPELWQLVGKLQFDYLTGHGLEPYHRLLEIGCGNLRAGRRFIEYLEPGHYTGVDISPEILLAAGDTVVEYGLQQRLPALYLVAGTSLAFLPSGRFDVVHAHSVFTHTPLEIVDAYLREVSRVLRPGGFFDFTYRHSEQDVWGVLDEDFYFPTALLLRQAEAHGFEGKRLEDWDYVQEKIRLTKI